MIKRDLSGTWKSRYQYGEARYSEHKIKLRQEGQVVKGRSLLHPDSSELELELELEGKFLTGTWREKTSPSGAYKGRIFFGAIQLILKSNTRMEGVWIGFSSDESRENIGEWILEKQTDENAEV